MDERLLSEGEFTDVWERKAPDHDTGWLHRLDFFAPLLAEEVGYKVAIRSLRALSDLPGMGIRYAPWSGLGHLSWGFVLQALAYRIHTGQNLDPEGSPEMVSPQQQFLVVWEAARWENHGFPPEDALLVAGLELVGHESATS